MTDSPANSGGAAATLEEEEKPRLIALVGNPNVGKSCLFNQLTGSRQKVANYPGVTVDARQGLAEDGSQVVDLPGTYGLRPSALDDAVTAEVILGERGEQPDVVVVVLDATNLRRSLYLYSEVADLGRPTVVALNMVDEARRGGLNLPDLAESLAVPVVETVAVTGEGTEELIAAIDRAAQPKPTWTLPEEPSEGQSRWERVRELEEAGTLAADAESTARYAWVADSEALCLEGLRAVELLLRSWEESPTQVWAFPDPRSQTLAHAAAVLFGADLGTWRPEVAGAPGLVVAYDLTGAPPELLQPLREKRPGQVLWQHAVCWTARQPIAPDLCTFVYQFVQDPWAAYVRPGADGPVEVAADPRGVEERARSILGADLPEDAGRGKAELLALAMLDSAPEAGPVARRDDGWRIRFWGTSPVRSSRFV